MKLVSKGIIMQFCEVCDQIQQLRSESLVQSEK